MKVSVLILLIFTQVFPNLTFSKLYITFLWLYYQKKNELAPFLQYAGGTPSLRMGKAGDEFDCFYSGLFACPWVQRQVHRLAGGFLGFRTHSEFVVV
jgi:hypothetical protein